MKKNYLFTSESVSEGHPDKVCDRISDMVVDTYLGAEPQSRVACETLTTTNKVVLAGEVRGPEIKKDDLIEKVRHCIKDIGYDQDGFTWKEAHGLYLDNVYKIDATYPLALALQLDEVSFISLYVHVFNLNEH